MWILSKYGVKPAPSAGSMMKVPGEFPISISLDLSEITPESRKMLYEELTSKGLRAEYHKETQTLDVEGQVEVLYSRGSDQNGQRAIWLTVEGEITNLVAESLRLLYASKDWGIPSSGRFLRAILTQIGSLTLPDGTSVFIGETEDYAQSILSTDGSLVHPKLTDAQKAILNATNDGDNIDDEDDPFA